MKSEIKSLEQFKALLNSLKFEKIAGQGNKSYWISNSTLLELEEIENPATDEESNINITIKDKVGIRLKDTK